MLLGLALVVSPTMGNEGVLVFQDDFNHDTVGERPNVDPPGPPTGDKLFMNARDGTIAVRDEVGDMTDQPLELNSSGGSPYFRFDAILDPGLMDCDSYTLRWRGMIHSGVFFATIAVRDEDGRLIASLEYRDSSVLSFNGSANRLAPNWFHNLSQLFEITADMNTQKVSLSIDGVPRPEAQDMDFYQSATGMEKFIITGTGSYSMVLDDLEFRGFGCPGVAAQDVSWSAVKARF
jgi:hypothetical protein